MTISIIHPMPSRAGHMTDLGPDVSVVCAEHTDTLSFCTICHPLHGTERLGELFLAPALSVDLEVSVVSHHHHMMGIFGVG